MRLTRVALGGGRRFFYPRFVWTPAAGWWESSYQGGKDYSLPVAVVLSASVYGAYSFAREHQVRDDATIVASLVL